MSFKIATYYGAFILVTTGILLSGCKKDNVDVGVQWDTSPYALAYGGLPQPLIPDDNALTNAGVQL